MRIVVTGGSGKIGSVVVEELLARGHQVINLDQRQSREPKAPFVYGDVHDREHLHRAFDGTDAVIHLAEFTHPYLPMPANDIFSRNVRAGSSVLQTAAEMKIPRVIYTSSFQVYGSWGIPAIPPAVLPVTENHPLRPQNVYSASKLANEMYARLMAEQYGLSVAVIRLPWVLTRQVTLQRVIDDSRSGADTRELGTVLHVDDAARGYAAAVEDHRPGLEIYNLAGPETTCTVPLRELMRRLGPDAPQIPPDWPDHKGAVDCTKALQHLGWQARWSYWEEFANWQRENPAKPKG